MKRIGTGASALLALGLAAGCAGEDVSIASNKLAITNGDPVDNNTYKSVGMLLARGNISEDGAEAVNRIMGICTGTLISPTAVLTAEHCVNQMILTQSLGQAKDEEGNPRNLTIEGEVMFQFTFARSIAEVMENKAEVFDVESVDEHETFAPLSNPLAALQPAPAKWDDIAIVHLGEKIKDRPYQKIAPTKLVNELMADAESLYRAAGYGLTNDDDPMSAGKLTSGVSHLNQVGDHEITAGNGDKQQACRGDSGGPIFSDETGDYQIGVASRVNRPLTIEDIIKGLNGTAMPPPCETGLAYTRVDAYLDWIGERVPDLPAADDVPTEDDDDDDGDKGGGADDGGGGGKGGGCSVGEAQNSDVASFGLLVLAGLWLARSSRRERRS
jgi:MYXO-CTERM domain-containing protein